jgi:integrase/recombinase XerD
MPYQYVREPLIPEEADRLANACETPTEQLIVWTLLDTGLRVGELCDLTSKDLLWQQRQLRVRGKGGPYGKKSKVRVVPMSRRVRALLEHHFALQLGTLRYLGFCPGDRISAPAEVIRSLADQLKVAPEVLSA